VTVTFSDQPQAVLDLAGEFLASRPVRHNLVLSLLHNRVAHPRPGRYWTVREDGHTLGVVFQSPTDYPALVTPIPAAAVPAAVAAVAETGVRLPGVMGEAATAARFAGHSTERHKSGAHPSAGQRLYQLDRLVPPPAVPGRLRPAERPDRSLILDWVHAFDVETGDKLQSSEEVVDRQLAANQLWLWEDGAPHSLAAHTAPVANVVRIQAVYTPPEQRGRGYAAACVAALSARLTDSGHVCALYTDLANPVSNSIYRRLGYRAVDEVVRYRFT
jgi:predicted GNAT family acetyltransferase